MNWNLWIDNEAFNKDAANFRKPTIDYYVALKEAIRITEYMKVSPNLDHDLGNGHNVMEYLKWLSNKFSNNCPDYIVHSANQQGKLNIVSFLDSCKRFLT